MCSIDLLVSVTIVKRIILLYVSTYDLNFYRQKLNRSRRNRTPGQNFDAEGANYLLGEFVKMFTEGKTPFERFKMLKERRTDAHRLSLDPDYYTNPIEDLGLMEAWPLKFKAC